MHCNNGLNNKLVVSLVENKVAEETGDLKYLQDSMHDFINTLKEIILGEYSPEFFNKYVDEALKLHGSNLDEFLKIPKMGLELRQALNSIDEAMNTSNQEFKNNLVLLLDRFQTNLDTMESEWLEIRDVTVRPDLANPEMGAAMVAYKEGTVADKLDEIVSGAVTGPMADAKITNHNQDVNAHPEIRTSIISEVSSHVTAEANRAETALAGVEQALSLGTADIYKDVASGLAGTTDTENFWVIPNEGDSIENLTLYNNNDSEAIKLYELYNLESYMIEEGSNWEVVNYVN